MSPPRDDPGIESQSRKGTPYPGVPLWESARSCYMPGQILGDISCTTLPELEGSSASLHPVPAGGITLPNQNTSGALRPLVYTASCLVEVLMFRPLVTASRINRLS